MKKFLQSTIMALAIIFGTVGSYAQTFTTSIISTNSGGANADGVYGVVLLAEPQLISSVQIISSATNTPAYRLYDTGSGYYIRTNSFLVASTTPTSESSSVAGTQGINPFSAGGTVTIGPAVGRSASISTAFATNSVIMQRPLISSGTLTAGSTTTLTFSPPFLAGSGLTVTNQAPIGGTLTFNIIAVPANRALAPEPP